MKRVEGNVTAVKAPGVISARARLALDYRHAERRPMAAKEQREKRIRESSTDANDVVLRTFRPRLHARAT
jgi:hypothetical protein